MRLLADPDGDGTYQYCYALELVTKAQPKASEDADVMPMPNTKASDAIIMSFGGESEDMNLTWWMYDNGENKAYDNINEVNTAPTGVYTNDKIKTIKEQIHYIRNYIKQPTPSSKHALTEIDPLQDKTGRFVDFSPDIVSDEPLRVKATLKFQVGQVIG